MSHSINFAEIKQRISIVQGAKFLGLSLTEDGKSLRCACSACDGDPRSLSLLEETNTFKCFKANVYGSVIDLVGHVKGLSLRESAQWLVEQENSEWLDEVSDLDPEDEEPVAVKALEKLPKLSADCEAINDMGLNPAIAKQAGIGFASKGLLKGCIGLPIYVDGNIVGYVGVPKGVWVKLPKNLMVQS